MKKFAGALATGMIVATTLGGMMAAPAFAADANTQTAQASQPMKKPMATAMSRKRVEQIQTALDNGGQNVAIDGIWGPKTIAAVRDFQKAHELKVTGHLDHETVMALPKVS